MRVTMDGPTALVTTTLKERLELGILAAVEESDHGFMLKQDWERIIQQDGTVDLIVFKAKRGTGQTGKIPLKMDKAKMTFRDRIENGKIDTVTTMKQSKFA